MMNDASREDESKGQAGRWTRRATGASTREDGTSRTGTPAACCCNFALHYFCYHDFSLFAACALLHFHHQCVCVCDALSSYRAFHITMRIYTAYVSQYLNKPSLIKYLQEN